MATCMKTSLCLIIRFSSLQWSDFCDMRQHIFISMIIFCISVQIGDMVFRSSAVSSHLQQTRVCEVSCNRLHAMCFKRVNCADRMVQNIYMYVYTFDMI